MDEVDAQVLAVLVEAPMPLDPTLAGERAGLRPEQAARALTRLCDRGLAERVDSGRYIPADGHHARSRRGGRRSATWTDVAVLALIVAFLLGLCSVAAWWTR